MQEKSVDRARPPEKLPLSATAGDDIPEALREEAAAKPLPQRTGVPLIWIGASIGTIALGLGIFLWYSSSGRTLSSQPISAAPEPPTSLTSLSASPIAEQTPALLKHLPYQQAPAQTLQSVVADGSIKLRQVAAQKFLEMVQAASAAGIFLQPISGFRSIADQEHIFFDVKAERSQGTLQRAAVSAPPGYSEHHTGYAIDIGDADRSETDLQVSFETTPAFQWLQKNAARFSFELSFPKDNPQGVSYEPWHWRFVGDRHSLETFYRAHKSAGQSNQPSNQQSAPVQIQPGQSALEPPAGQ